MLRYTRFHVIVCALLAMCTTQTVVGEIDWKAGKRSMGPQDSEAVRGAIQTLGARTDARRVLIRFESPLDSEQRRQMANAGVVLLNYVGDNAYFATLKADGLDVDAVVGTGLVTAVSAIDRALKLHGDLARGEVHAWSVVARPKGEGDSSELVVAAYVLLHADVRLEPDGERICLEHGARIRSRLKSINALVIELPYSQISGLADEDAIQWIEPPLPKFSELNNDNRLRTGADIVQAAPYGLDGSGVSVLVYDGGFGLSSHPDFGGRHHTRDSSGLSDHSTHVAGTVGGSGVDSGGAYRGMAPGVEIESYGFEQVGGLQEGFLYTDPGDLEADYDEAINVFGAHISNNSIGTNTAPNGYPCEWEGNYGITGNLIDSIAAGSLGAPFRIVWANGNERQVSRCGTTYVTTAPPACAKNHITVGALNSNDDSVTSFTSWGPTDDGRIKPDVSGPGCQSSDDFDVTSCSSFGGYTGKCGTSMASPTVCGLSALLLQDFRAQYPGEPDFRNSMLKAFLAHTAEDIENPGPDYMTGYGSVRIQPAIELMRAGNFLSDEVDQGGTYSALVVVNPGDGALKVTLAWDDVPGTPNVNPVLVNDLDLEVFDPGDTQYFPWTLDPGNPAVDAIRTQADHANNIEQVVIDAPAPGVYRVDINGFNVPQGPQNFSLTASPALVACSTTGVVTLDRVKYACSGSATIRVVDCDLNADDGAIETVSVSIASSSEPAGETVLLTETAAETAAFAGVIPLNTSAGGSGELTIADGDTVTATYIDANDGQGGLNVTVTDTAIVDCSPPVISNVQTQDIEPRSASITFETDEDTLVQVRYGLACAALTDTASDGLGTIHSVSVAQLEDNTAYFFSIEAEDQAGNTTVDDNGGGCYTFMTPEVPDFFTEQFGGDFDLAGFTAEHVPNASVDEYAICGYPATLLPTDPAGGSVLSLSDDGSATATLTAGAQVLLYGESYGSFFVNANGNLTFDSTDGTYTESLDVHFNQPRVSALFDDLNPSVGGTMSWKQLADRVAVTWEGVPEYSTSNSNTFQIEMFFDGRINITWLGIDSGDSVIGLSEGLGLSPDYFESDLSGVGSCGPRPPSAGNVSVVVGENSEATITLLASDDGLPDPPAALTYIVTSLPTEELRDAGTDEVIVTVPHTLSGGGNQVIYSTSSPFSGADSFQFKANDAGVAPDGGDSNIATVGITVEPVLDLPFFEDFPTTTFDSGKWSVVQTADIDGVGIGEPSEPNAARFNGDPSGADEIQTQLINLSGPSIVNLSYSWERTGGGESPDAGDDLFVEFLDNVGTWQLISQHFGSDPDMVSFQREAVVLPPEALHATFRLRFRNTATSGAFDDWFVDDISLSAPNAPTAFGQSVNTPRFAATDITLTGDDPNEDPLAFVIASLPANGQLSDPNGGEVAAVPYMLADNGDVVHFAPTPLGFLGKVSFDFYVSDGSSDSSAATVVVTVGDKAPVYQFLVDDADPGWTTEGQWAFGPPTGGGSHDGDPSSGFTGANVYGYNLDGDYTSGMSVQRLTSIGLPTPNLVGTELRFQRWLGIEAAASDQASIEISNTPGVWSPIWEHAGAAISESAWSQQTIDISADGDMKTKVYFRWNIGPTDGSTNYPGWNIDDIEVWGIDVTASLCAGVAFQPADANADGSVNGLDVRTFVGILTDPLAGWSAGQICAAEMTGDEQVDLADVDPFVAELLGP